MTIIFESYIINPFFNESKYESCIGLVGQENLNWLDRDSYKPGTTTVIVGDLVVLRYGIDTLFFRDPNRYESSL